MSTRQFPFLVRSEASVRSQGRGPTGQPGPVRGVGETGRRASAGSAGQTARAQGQRARAGRPSGLRVRSWVQGEGSRRRGGGEGGRPGREQESAGARLNRPHQPEAAGGPERSGPWACRPPPNLGAPLGRGGAHAWPRRHRREESVSALQPSPRLGAVSGHRRALEGAARLRGRGPGRGGPRVERGARAPGKAVQAPPGPRRAFCAVAVTATCGGRARCRPAGRARGADACRAGGKPWGGWRPASWPPLGAACGAGRRQHGPSR